MDEQTAQFYEQRAVEVATRYENVASPIARYFDAAFVPGSRVLDIGAGSGRDCACLLANGFDAFGVEPCEGLRLAAVTAHPALANRLQAASLPQLGLPFGGEFDGIVCSAVLMHVPAYELFDAAMAIRAVLKVHGRLLISLPLSRGDVLPGGRDGDGRLFEDYKVGEIQLLFERLGFALIGRWESQDALARAQTSWFTLLLERRDGDGLRAVDKIPLCQTSCRLTK